MKNMLISFIINPRFRIYRHLLLLLLAELFALQNTFSGFDGMGCMLANIVNVVFFAGLIYLNVYFYTPKLLIHNKILIYIFAIALTIIIGLLFIAVIQGLLYKNYGVSRYIPDENPYSYLNIISAFLITTFIVTGSSTIVLFQRWITHGQQISDLETATMAQELKLLKNQINPHFLFNMLNNANELVLTNSDEATIVLTKLNDLLRYQLNDSIQEKVSLISEIHFLTDYLNLEKIRKDNFDFIVSKEGNINNVTIPPLIFITFVENAVKHNTYGKKKAFVNLYFKVLNNKLLFSCENSRAETITKENIGGLGLTNIRRRLDLLYGKNYLLEVIETESIYRINLTFRL